MEIADRVLVLEHGRIVEDGSPQDLVAADGGRYAALARRVGGVAGLATLSGAGLAVRPASAGPSPAGRGPSAAR